MSRTRSRPSSPASRTASSTRCASGSQCTIALRGNRLTLGGDDEHVAAARAVVDELVELVEGGHEIGPDTVGAVLAALDQAEDVREVFDDVVWRHRGKNITPKTVNQKRYVDAIRARDRDVRDRPRRNGEDVPRDGARRLRALRGRGRPRHPHAPRGRGGRAARIPPGRHAREGRSVPAPALRRALRHARRRAPRRLHGARDDRGRAARVHARAHAQRLLRRPRRGAEHDAGADADVPHAARVRLEDGRDRRRDAGRPPARAGLGPHPGARDPRRHRRRSASSSSATRTSCGTSSCSGSSRRTSATPRRPARRVAGDRRRDGEPQRRRGRRAARPTELARAGSRRRGRRRTASSGSRSSGRTRCAR